MSSPDSPNAFFARLALRYTPAWRLLGTQSFAGEMTITTKNSVYRFGNGLFTGRAQQGRSFEAPEYMSGVRLIGFLGSNGFSQQWRAGARAVLWNGGMEMDSFVFTSPIVDVSHEQIAPKPAAKLARMSSRHVRVAIRQAAPPPTYRRPHPPSMTRLHNVPSGEFQR